MEKKNMMIIVAALIIIVVVAAAAVVVMTGDDNDNNDNDEEEDAVFEPRTVTDGLGRQVTVTKVDKITSSGATVSAMLCGLGLSDRIVGATTDEGVYLEDPRIIGVTDDDFPKAIVDGLNAGTIKDLGAMWGMSAETVASAGGDIVVFTEFGFKPETGTELDKLGITYVVLKNEANLQIAEDNIILLGDVFDKQSEAKNLVSEMNNVIDKVKKWCNNIDNTKLNGEKRVVAVMMTKTFATGPEYIDGTVVAELGAINAFPEVGNYKEVSYEAIAAKNPEIMIYTSLGMGDGVTDPEAYIESIYEDPILGGIDASKNKQIHTCTGGAKNAIAYVDQGYVNAYAIYAMFIYQDFLGFDIPTVFTTENYYEYTEKFWNMIQ